MAKWLKRTVEKALARSGLPSGLRALTGESVAVLAYHNVVPDGEAVVGDLTLHIRQRDFAAHLDRLEETHQVVSLTSMREGDVRPPGRPRAVITFDDAYDGALTAGLAETARRGMPATVFVAPGLLGLEGFWWDLLAARGGLAPELRRQGLDVLSGAQNTILSWAATQKLAKAQLPGHARPAKEAVLAKAAGMPGVTLGSHTWSHPNLKALDSTECAIELDRTRVWLREVAGDYVDWLAYPYGLHDDSVVKTTEERAEGAVLIRGGLAKVGGQWTSSRHRVPRLTVPANLSPDGLTLRLAGLHPSFP